MGNAGISLQTCGSFAAHFNPHCHRLFTEGAFTPQGESVPLPTPATYRPADIEERFRQLLLCRLHRPEFMQGMTKISELHISVSDENCDIYSIKQTVGIGISGAPPTRPKTEGKRKAAA